MNKKTTIWIVALLIAVAAVGAGVYFVTKPAGALQISWVKRLLHPYCHYPYLTCLSVLYPY